MDKHDDAIAELEHLESIVYVAKAAMAGYKKNKPFSKTINQSNPRGNLK